jgi:ABC-type enterochelin transport system substrate-binding protein
MSRGVNYQQQITFIIKNVDILDYKTKMNILSIVMMDIGMSVVTEIKGTKGTDINLDLILEKNPDIITHIYNIILARRESLNQPAIK